MDETLIASLKNGDMQALGELYSKYRQEFIAMIRAKYKMSNDDAMDIYQVATLRLYNNVVKGKMTMMYDSIKPYLFSIGLNVYKEMVREDMKIPLSSNPLEWVDDRGEGQEATDEALLKESLLEATKKAIEKLGDPCQSMLTRFYYFRASIRQLMEEFGYKNEATAKNKKYKCLQQLRELLQKEKIQMALA
ncbi:MAG: RNA polymerase sigma factor [Imperialibacter sp.]|uniref:RNA polymerase sigma factor n=1 Tax=Imperialibacter sp. TaxID=2038411 RepID=UPI003A843139|tara:strand:+ start:28474 stop:29046 length:573 start_codon:yes stop_codon:yes gene_type:complete